MLVHEGFALHERLRGRSAFWLHRLELGAALHWVTLALALAFDASSVFGAPPPPVGVLLHLPAACLVCVTVLEQLPGDESEIAVLLRAAARVSAPGDLRHMCSNSWYRGLLDLLVQSPESLIGFVDLARAQRSLPWWLRPPLPDAADLRASALPLTTLGGLSISDVLNGDGSVTGTPPRPEAGHWSESFRSRGGRQRDDSVTAARLRSSTFGLQYSALPSSGSLADLAGSALLKVASLTWLGSGLGSRHSPIPCPNPNPIPIPNPNPNSNPNKVASLTALADLTVPGLKRRGSMEGLLAVSQPLRRCSTMHQCTNAPMRQGAIAPMHQCTNAQCAACRRGCWPRSPPS